MANAVHKADRSSRASPGLSRKARGTVGVPFAETPAGGAVKSVWRAFKILESFETGGMMGVTELSRKLDFPKSSVYEIVTTLVGQGILEKDPERNRYRLGLRLFELGNRARDSLEIRRVASPLLKTLNRELDETVHLTVLESGEVLYVECFESTKRLRTYSVIGVRAPLHCTAVGKAILAFLGRDEIEEIIRNKGLPGFTERTITDRGALLAELDRIVASGYAVDNMEHEEGARCVGSPIRNGIGRVFASISVSGPSQRITEQRIPEIGKLVMAAAAEISRRLGYGSR
ncbi:MAG: IclR family transcriptional regulator [Deltaproteobacteria bacterium]|nr:IclR family transcriptional regulator [Deltaproteobacteria bacterium]